MCALTTNVFPICQRSSQPDVASHDVSVKEMIASIYEDIASTNDKVINFALAVPDVSLAPGCQDQ